MHKFSYWSGNWRSHSISSAAHSSATRVRSVASVQPSRLPAATRAPVQIHTSPNWATAAAPSTPSASQTVQASVPLRVQSGVSNCRTTAKTTASCTPGQTAELSVRDPRVPWRSASSGTSTPTCTATHFGALPHPVASLSTTPVRAEGLRASSPYCPLSNGLPADLQTRAVLEANAETRAASEVQSRCRTYSTQVPSTWQAGLQQNSRWILVHFQ